jgi:hypothetical protein
MHCTLGLEVAAEVFGAVEPQPPAGDGAIIHAGQVAAAAPASVA